MMVGWWHCVRKLGFPKNISYIGMHTYDYKSCLIIFV